MTRVIAAGAILLASTALVQAGGIERSAQSMALLFEEGTYAELSFSHVRPEVSGTSVFAVPPNPGAPAGIPAGQNSRNMAPTYNNLAFGYRRDLSGPLSLALIVDQPVGADVNYPAIGLPPNAYLYGGSTAQITSTAVSTYLRYEMPNNFSVYGGLRVVEADGEARLFSGYTLNASGSTEIGYALGVAYERPEIALRVALTYFSETEHRFTSTENNIATAGFTTTIPQAVNLEFQSGIAADTLLFGSIRWVDWSVFSIAPPAFVAAPTNINREALVDYDNDTTTYTLGLGRRFNETWSGAVSVVHEPSTGGFAGNLGPTDGRTGVGLGVTWTGTTGLKISGGVQYSWVGDATTAAPTAFTGGAQVPFARFTDNTTTAFGLRIGYQF